MGVDVDAELMGGYGNDSCCSSSWTTTNQLMVARQATTGPQALALAANPNVRLLLTDSVMPQMSGPELAQQIRTLRPGLPVLFMSGYAQGVLGTQRIPSDAPLLQKPFNAHTLLTHVRAAISGASEDPSRQRRLSLHWPAGRERVTPTQAGEAKEPDLR